MYCTYIRTYHHRHRVHDPEDDNDDDDDADDNDDDGNDDHGLRDIYDGDDHDILRTADSIEY